MSSFTYVVKRFSTTFGASLVCALLAGCAPTETAATGSAAPVAKQDFYPSQPGLTWNYTDPNALPTAPKIQFKIEGTPTIDGKTYNQLSIIIPKQRRDYYRTIDASGVKLHMMDENILLTRTYYSPAWVEYPAQAALEVGFSWGGTTKASTVTIYKGVTTVIKEQTLKYTYTIKDKGPVVVEGTRYEGYKLDLQVSELGNPATEGMSLTGNIWYVPYVGEVITKEGLQLATKNF